MFSSPNDEELKTHISEQHSNAICNQFKCSDCDYETSTESSMKEHSELDHTLGFKRRKSDVTPFLRVS